MNKYHRAPNGRVFAVVCPYTARSPPRHRSANTTRIRIEPAAILPHQKRLQKILLAVTLLYICDIIGVKHSWKPLQALRTEIST